MTPLVAIGIVPIFNIGSFPGRKRSQGQKSAIQLDWQCPIVAEEDIACNDDDGIYLGIVLYKSSLTLALFSSTRVTLLLSRDDSSTSPSVIPESSLESVCVGDTLGCGISLQADIDNNDQSKRFLDFYVRNDSSSLPIMRHLCSVQIQSALKPQKDGRVSYYAPVVWMQTVRKMLQQS